MSKHKVEDLTLEEAQKIIDDAPDGAVKYNVESELYYAKAVGNSLFFFNCDVLMAEVDSKLTHSDYEKAFFLTDVETHINRIKNGAATKIPSHEEETFAPLEEKAMRFNTGKPELSYLLDAPVAVKGLCEVFAMGAEKYARDNWKKGLEKDQIIDSLLRHLIAFKNGESIDPESKKSHTFHVLWNALVLAEQHSGE